MENEDEYYIVRFQPYYAKRRIKRIGKLTAETMTAYYFLETDAKGQPKLTRDKVNNRDKTNHFTVLKSDAELEKINPPSTENK